MVITRKTNKRTAKNNKQTAKPNTTKKNVLSFPTYNNDTIILFKPNKKAIEYANKNLHKYLFRTKVNADIAIKQHQYFKDALTKQRQPFIDISDYVVKDTPIEYFANLLFTRDPFIRTKKGIVLGNMREPVRKHDTELMSKIMTKFKQHVLYRCKGDEFLEGGDFLMNCDTSFIGTGARTSMSAAKKLLKMNLYGTQKVVIIYPVKPDTSMYRIHLDCIFSPFGCKQCVIWNGLTHANKRMAIEYTLQNNGTYKKTGLTKNFIDYLKDNNYNVIPLSTESQHNYGANILELSNGNVLVQDKETHKKIPGSIFIPFHEIHKMYGGLHCSSNSFINH